MSKIPKDKQEHYGGCLCNETTYLARGKAKNPHLCSCTMCQRSSGAPTVAWVDFPLKDFQWTGAQPNLYRSSEKTQRCSCKKCGGLLGAIDDGSEDIGVTLVSLKNYDQIVPNKKHSYKESIPSWWDVHIKT
jgi:hypothetical protein